MNSKTKEGASSSGGQPGASGAPPGSGKDDPRTRLQKRKMLESDNFKKRKVSGETLFKTSKIIGRNDVLVDTSCGKVKVEVPEEEDVKPEVKVFTEEVDLVEGPAAVGGALDAGLGGEEEIIVKPEPMEEEEGVNVHSTVNDESEMTLTISGTRSISVGLSKEAKSKEELERENRSLRELVADQALEIQSLRKKLKEAEAALVTERGLRPSDELLVDDENLEVVELSDSDLKISFENNFGTEFGKVAPFLLQFLDLTQVQKCRLVSHKWKNAVDSWLEAHLLRFVTGKTTIITDLESDNDEDEYYGYDDDEDEEESEEDELFDEDKKSKERVVSHQSHVLPLAVQQLQAKYTFSEKQDFVKFQEYAINLKGNPFVGHCAIFKVTKETLQMTENLKNRNVTVGSWQYDDSLDFHKNYNNYKSLESELKDCALKFWEEIGSFLAPYEEHLWHVSLIQDGCGLTPKVLYDISKVVLRHLKNLKTLSFDVTFMTMLASEHPWNCCYKPTGRPRKCTGGIIPPCKCNAGSVDRLLKYRASELRQRSLFLVEIKRLLNLQLEAVKIRVRDAYFKKPGWEMPDTSFAEYQYQKCLSHQKLWNICPNLKCIVLDFLLQEEKFNPAGAEVKSSPYQKTCVLTCTRSKKEYLAFVKKVQAAVL